MAITGAKIARAITVESELKVRLPDDYRKLLDEEDGFYDEDDLMVYGYDGEMGHNDPRCVIGTTRRFREQFPEAPDSYLVISHDKLNKFPVVLDTEKGTVHDFIDGKKGAFHKSFEEWLNCQFMDEKFRFSYEMNRKIVALEAVERPKLPPFVPPIDPKIELQRKQIQTLGQLIDSVERTGVNTIGAIEKTGGQQRETLDKVGTGIEDAIIEKGHETKRSIDNLANQTSKAIEESREKSIEAIKQTTQQKINSLDETSHTLVNTIKKVGSDNVDAVNAANESSTKWAKKTIKWGALVAFLAAILGAVLGTVLTLRYSTPSGQDSDESKSVQQSPSTPQPTPQIQPPAQKSPQNKPAPQTPHKKPAPTNNDLDSSGVIET